MIELIFFISLLVLLFKLLGGPPKHNNEPSFFEASAYYMEVQNVLMEYAGVDLKTAKQFVSDHYHVLYEANQASVAAEKAAFLACASVLQGNLVAGGRHDKNVNTAMLFAQGVVKKMPNTKTAEEYQRLYDEQLSRNVQMGLNGVRAFIYLTMINIKSATPDEANFEAMLYDVDMPTEIIVASNEYAPCVYGGSQRAMIADAESKGFVSALI